MARPIERYCKRGHDTHVLGRIHRGWCKACALESEARRMYGGAAPLRRRLPIEPLRRALKLRVDEYAGIYATLGRADNGVHQLATDYARRFGIDPRSAARHLHRILNTNATISEDLADRWCVLLGLHLDMVFDDEEAMA